MAAPQPLPNRAGDEDSSPRRSWSIVAVPPRRTRALRRRILGGGRGGRYLDDVGPTGLHLGAFDGEGRLIGSVAVHPEPLPGGNDGAPPAQWRLRAMAVEPAWRRRGVGGELLRAALAHARAEGAQGLWCHALESARGFYLRLGFVDAGEPFVPPVPPGAAPHRTMRFGAES